MANVVTVQDGIFVGRPVTEAGLKLNGHLYTLASDFGSWADGVMYAHDRGKVLMSLDGLAGFAYDTKGEYCSYEPHCSRTFTSYVTEGDVLRAYVCELPAEKLVAVAEKVRGKSFLDVRLDGELAQFMKREAGNRKFAVPERDLELSVVAKNGKSAFGRDSIIRMYLPNNAEKAAANNVRCNFGLGRAWFDNSKIENGYMHIQPVTLCVGTNGINAAENCEGRARGE